MPTAVFMPKFEMTQESGTIVAWLKDEGEQVEKGEPLLEVETDKATQEVESPATGTLAAVSGEPGQVIPIATPIAYILKPGETLDSIPSDGQGAVESPSPSQGSDKGPGAPAADDGPARATPRRSRCR